MNLQTENLIFKAYFKGNEVYIFILLEFQSTVDRFMTLRMLRYITELYEYLNRSYKLKKLPAVFPIMLYNGEKRWTAPEELSILIEESIPEKYIPRFSYYKIAENEFGKDFLKGIKNSVAALFYTENCSSEELQHEIDTIVDLLQTEKPGETALFINWFKYMFSHREELVDEVKGLDEVKSMLRTSLKKEREQLKKEGIQEGIQVGILVEKRKTAANLLKEKMPVSKISEITGLPVDEIKKLIG